jgi:hypothetical protein
MPVLSDADIARLAAAAGFSGPDLETAVAVALAESGGDSSRLGDLTAQHAIVAQRGWQPWASYRNGDYQNFLDRARKAIGAGSQQQAPTTPSAPAAGAGQQSGAGGGNGMSAVLGDLFSALPKLLRSGDRLGKVGQAAQQATARQGAFGDVPGSRNAEAGNARNAQRHAQHAHGARRRVNQIGADVNTSGKEYERVDQENASDQKQEYLKIDNAYDPYRTMA